MKFTPRPYQARLLESVRASYRSGHRAIVVVLPTGGGKTFVATQLAQPALEKSKRVYFLVHREELADQARKAFERIGFPAGMIAAGHPRTSHRFQIVSLQTAVSRQMRLAPDLAIIDECHHVAADRWAEPVKAMRGNHVPIIGLTATPDRGDGRGLAPLFDDIVIGAQPRELIESGHLVPCRVLSPPAARKTLAEHPVEARRLYATGRRTIVFAGTVDYARKLSGEFNLSGSKAACVDGRMTDADRMKAIARFREGALDVLTSVAVLTEGFDVPETSCVITTTGASAPGPLIQKVGRGMRTAPGKRDCIHLDLRGAWRELGMLPDEDRHFELNGRAITGTTRERGDAVVQCRGCGCWFRANEFRDSQCPECHRVRKGKEDPRVRRARLAVLAERDVESDRVVFLARQINAVWGKRKKDGTPYRAVGFALQRYRVRYRDWPTNDVKNRAVQMAARMRESA